MELLVQIILAMVMLAGALGAVLPVLPGAPIAFASLLLARILHFSELSWWVIGIFGFLTVLGIVLDYAVPVAATRKMGGSKYGIWGLVIGLIIGILFSPFGLVSIVVVPFLGALAGELLYDRKNHKRAFKAASGTIFAYFLTSGYGMLLSLAMLAVFLYNDVFK